MIKELNNSFYVAWTSCFISYDIRVDGKHGAADCLLGNVFSEPSKGTLANRRSAVIVACVELRLILRCVGVTGHRNCFSAGTRHSIKAVYGDPFVLRLQHEAKRICRSLHSFITYCYFGSVFSDGD